MFTIEKQVALPSGKSKYPFSSMQREDSFIVPYDGKDRSKLVVAVRQAAKRYAKNTQMQFVVRVMDDGVRVWRLA